MNEQHLVEILESLNCEFLKFEESTYYFVDKETDLVLTFSQEVKQNQVIASVLEKRDEFEMLNKVSCGNFLEVVPAPVTEAIREIIDYLWEEEKKSYESSEPCVEHGHIFTSLIIVRDWLEKNEKGGDQR